MKKLIAIAVLFVGITAAVLAQDGEWKVGFLAQYVTDMLYATSTKWKEVDTPLNTASKTTEFGNYNKGTINFFGNEARVPHADNRVMLSISNSGENYKVYADIKLDDKAWQNWPGVMSFLNGGSADWYFKGDAGIFSASVGTNGWGGFVDPLGTWNSWLGWNMLSRFGVWRGNSDAYNGDFFQSNDFRTWNQWGAIAALGATFADNYRFSLGYRFDPYTTAYPAGGGYWEPGGSGMDSKSSINAAFMFSGRPVDGITFDLVYAVLGKDDKTMERPKGTFYEPPVAYWSNTIGAYVGLNIIDNLGISLGYAVNFNAYEAGGWLGTTDEANRAVTYKAPIYSGIDLHVKYTGIDNVPITFSNNFSFAGAKGQKNFKSDPATTGAYFDTLVTNLTEDDVLDEGYSEDWFHWNGELTVGLGFIDGVGLTVSLGDKLAATTKTFVNPDVDYKTGEPEDKGIQAKRVGTVLENELRVSVFATHGVGAVTVGAGLFFSLNSSLDTVDRTYPPNVGSARYVLSSDTVTFGIPIMFKVAF